MKMMTRLASAATLLLLSCGHAAASDVDELTDMLNEFLANSHLEVAHASFWADDLVYTSSAGLRFGKSDILAGFQDAADSETPPETSYSAAETDIRLYGDTAIVAFKLVGESATGSKTDYYYNTGTFLRRSGVWQVVAWQATKIPPA